MRILTLTYFLYFVGHLCVVAQPQGFSTTILDSLEKRLATLPNDTNRINTLAEVATLYSNTNVEKSILLGEEALTLTRKLNYDNGFRKVLGPLSFQYSISGQWAKGLELALEGKERYKDILNERSYYCNRAQLAYQFQGDYKRCLEECHENIQLFNNHPEIDFNPVDKWASYMTASEMYSNFQQADTALIFGFKSLGYGQSIKFNTGHFVGYAHYAIGIAYLTQNKPDSALSHLHIMRTSTAQINNQFALQETQIYLAKAMQKKGIPDSVYYYAKTAYDGATKLGNDINEMNAALILSEYFEKSNPTQSLFYLKNHNALKEKLFTQDQTNKRYFLESEQRNKRTELEKKEINTKNRVRQNTLLGGLFTFILLAGVLIYTNRRRKLLNDTLQQQKLHIENQNQDLVKSSNELALKNRDLEIEAALDKIRSTSLAMHQSHEIQNVVGVLFEKLKELGLVFDAGAAIHLFTEGVKDAVIWIETSDQLSPTSKVNLPYDPEAFEGNPIILDVWNAHETGKHIVNKVYSFEEKNKYFNYVFKHNDYVTIPEFARNQILKVEGYTASFVSEKHSLLGAASWSGQKFSETEFDILKRIARVFEQAYTRFLDLQKAEAQAREAQIEVALERVRSKTMAMQHSNQLREIAATTLAQLQNLGFTYGACSIVIMDANTGNMTWWISGFEKDYPASYRIPYFEHPFYLEQLNNWKDGKKYAVMVCEGVAKKAYDEFIFSKTEFVKIPVELQKIMQAFEKITFSNAYMKHGALSWSTEPLGDEYAKILQRFAGVFEQSYTRFLDLQKAEAQTREAKIEAALEKIRARALAMHASHEIYEVAQTLREQMGLLNQPELEASVIHLYDVENGVADSWHAYRPPSEESGEITSGKFQFRFDESALTQLFLKHYQSNDDEYTIEAKGDILREWAIILVEKSPDIKKYVGDKIPEVGFHHFSKFSGGALLMVTRDNPSDVVRYLQKRAASVFDFAYKRFLDLQKAEAQAREAQIEAALENIRSASLAMHKTDELMNVVNVMQQKLKDLEAVNGSVAIQLFNKENLYSEQWMGTDVQNNTVICMPYDDKLMKEGFMKDAWEAWDKKENIINRIYPLELKNKFFKYVFDNNDEITIPYHVRELINETPIHIVCLFPEKHSALFADSWTGQEYDKNKIEIIVRVAKVFDQAYVRFLDLQKAEAQAREAQIEVSLERMRSRAMTMNTSDELNALIGFIYKECSKLDMHLYRSLIMTFDKITNDTRWWVAGHEASDVPMSCFVQYHEYAPSLAILKGWQNREQKWTYHLEGDNKKCWDAYVFEETGLVELPEPLKVGMRSYESIILNASFQNFGCVMLASFEPMIDEHFDLLVRLSKVFELAYTRFLDLQLKEQNALKLMEEKQKLEQTLTELRVTQTQLIQKEKLASLGELTAGIAHEIQNPLNFVNNFSELSVDLVKDLNEEIEKPDIDKEYVRELFTDLSQNQEKINHHGKRASSIVKGMLEHSRASTGTRELTDINKLADEYLRLSYHGLRAKDKDFNADFKTEFDPNLPKINVIPQDIGRVLLNLINNAFYAVNQRKQAPQPPEGENYVPTVIVSTHYLAPLSGAGGAQIIIKVKDNGTGMPESVKAKVFQPFFTTKPTGQGTGLGLSLAYDIVTKGHGGALEVTSTEGVGSAFIISLPFKTNG